MASGLEAKSYGEYSRRSSYKKETLPYLSYTYVWLTYDNTFICGGEWRSAITWWCTVGGDFFGRGIWDQTPNTRRSSFSHTRAIPRKSPIGGESPIGFSHTSAIARKSPIGGESPIGFSHTSAIPRKSPIGGESPIGFSHTSAIPRKSEAKPYRLQKKRVSGIAKSYRGKKEHPAIPEPYVRMPKLCPGFFLRW